jgi:putative transposase
LADKFECAVHATCLMTNHVHLLLTSRRADGSALLMRHLGTAPCSTCEPDIRAQRPIVGRALRSCLVDAEPCLLACRRYVELNPVRAAMVRHPRQYRWSSYRFNAEGRAGALIMPHELYRRLGRSAQARQ